VTGADAIARRAVRICVAGIGAGARAGGVAEWCVNCGMAETGDLPRVSRRFPLHGSPATATARVLYHVSTEMSYILLRRRTDLVTCRAKLAASPLHLVVNRNRKTLELGLRLTFSFSNMTTHRF
jgi:hypothetical protein